MVPPVAIADALGVARPGPDRGHRLLRPTADRWRRGHQQHSDDEHHDHHNAEYDHHHDAVGDHDAIRDNVHYRPTGATPTERSSTPDPAAPTAATAATASDHEATTSPARAVCDNHSGTPAPDYAAARRALTSTRGSEPATAGDTLGGRGKQRSVGARTRLAQTHRAGGMGPAIAVLIGLIVWGSLQLLQDPKTPPATTPSTTKTTTTVTTTTPPTPTTSKTTTTTTTPPPEETHLHPPPDAPTNPAPSHHCPFPRLCPGRSGADYH